MPAVSSTHPCSVLMGRPGNAPERIRKPGCGRRGVSHALTASMQAASAPRRGPSSPAVSYPSTGDFWYEDGGERWAASTASPVAVRACQLPLSSPSPRRCTRGPQEGGKACGPRVVVRHPGKGEGAWMGATYHSPRWHVRSRRAPGHQERAGAVRRRCWRGRGTRDDGPRSPPHGRGARDATLSYGFQDARTPDGAPSWTPLARAASAPWCHCRAYGGPTNGQGAWPPRVDDMP
jgi:hypothetical protein